MVIKKDDVIEFFNEHAKSWDEEMIKSEEIVNLILENARVTSGNKVLDVATGTGILIGDYKRRGIEEITAIDISPQMVKLCAEKHPDIKVICGDADCYEFEERYDNIVIYNAFPHFPEPDKLIAHLSKYLNSNGTLTVAHGMSREKIDKHHEGAANKVSCGLMTIEELEQIVSKYLIVTEKISDDRMYQIVGLKNNL